MASIDPPAERTLGLPRPRRSTLGSFVVIAAFVIGGLGVVSCHSGSSSAGSTTTRQTANSGATATTVVPNSVADSTTPPSLDSAFTPDPLLVFRTLSAYSDWLFAHPNPALLSNYMLRSSRNFSSVMQQLAMLAAHGWHARPSQTQIAFLKANGPFQPEGTTVGGHQAYLGTNVRVVVSYNPQSNDVLNSAGEVVAGEHFDNPSEEFLVVDLAQGNDGRFRISDISSENPPGGIKAFES